MERLQVGRKLVSAGGSRADRQGRLSDTRLPAVRLHGLLSLALPGLSLLDVTGRLRQLLLQLQPICFILPRCFGVLQQDMICVTAAVWVKKLGEQEAGNFPTYSCFTLNSYCMCII